MATPASPLLGLAVLIAIGVAGLLVLAACLPRRCRIQQIVVVNVAPATPQRLTLVVSPDGRYWWDGVTWLDAAGCAPIGAVRSPDGRHWWSGVEWLPRPAELPS
ncbi:MAG: hypothetical protein JOZ75_04290, partial [Candidatus Dormibacteraeota bacterium]|nr:hypothetical protein [Candidatus Dormibacteraeota bacterium]